MCRLRAFQAVLDDTHPAPREEPAVDQRPAFVLRQTRRALTFQMPKPDVVNPRRRPPRDALQAQIRILVVAEDEVLREAAEMLVPGALDRDESAGDRRYRTRAVEEYVAGRGALAVVLCAAEACRRRTSARERESDVELEVHSTVHQRAVIVV